MGGLPSPASQPKTFAPKLWSASRSQSSAQPLSLRSCCSSPTDTRFSSLPSDTVRREEIRVSSPSLASWHLSPFYCVSPQTECNAVIPAPLPPPAARASV